MLIICLETKGNTISPKNLKAMKVFSVFIDLLWEIIDLVLVKFFLQKAIFKLTLRAVRTPLRRKILRREKYYNNLDFTILKFSSFFGFLFWREVLVKKL